MLGIRVRGWLLLTSRDGEACNMCILVTLHERLNQIHPLFQTVNVNIHASKSTAIAILLRVWDFTNMQYGSRGNDVIKQLCNADS